jgi:protein-tyrosine phosphatase
MDLFWVTENLAVATRPRGGDWLTGDLDRLRAVGIDVLVSCLTTSEEEELELGDEETVAKSAGMEFVRTTIEDLSVPAAGAVDRAVEGLECAVQAGRRVAIHCRMGLGRSPMIAAAVLIAGGTHADDAISQVATARGVAVPETKEQRAWLAAR